MLYKITLCFQPALWCYIPYSSGLTLLLFHFLLPLVLPRLRHIFPWLYRWTPPSLCSHYSYSGRLIPFTIFIFLVVTSLLLLYLFFKWRRKARLLARLHSVFKMQQHSELTQSMYYSPFASEGKAMNGRRIHQEQWKGKEAARPGADTLGGSTAGRGTHHIPPALAFNISMCYRQTSRDKTSG